MKKFPEFCKYVNFPSTLPIIKSKSPSPFISPAVGEHQSFVKENFDDGDRIKLVSIHLGSLADPIFFQNSIPCDVPIIKSSNPSLFISASSGTAYLPASCILF